MADVCRPPYSNNVGTVLVIVDICVVSAFDFRIVKLHMQMYKSHKRKCYLFMQLIQN